MAKTTAPPTAPPTIAPILGPPDGPLGFAVVVGTFVVVDLEVGSEDVATVFVVVVCANVELCVEDRVRTEVETV